MKGATSELDINLWKEQYTSFIHVGELRIFDGIEIHIVKKSMSPFMCHGLSYTWHKHQEHVAMTRF